MKPSVPLSTTPAVLLGTMLACRPVIAIGWTELAIIIVIVLVLFAPVLFRLFRFFLQHQESPDEEPHKHDS